MTHGDVISISITVDQDGSSSVPFSSLREWMSRPSSLPAHLLSGALLEDPAENRPSIMADNGGFDWEDMFEAANRTPDASAPMPLDHPERERPHRAVVPGRPAHPTVQWR